MSMRKLIPGKNPIEFAKPQGNEKGNKNQWKQELGGEASLIRIERGGKQLRVISAKHFSEQAARFFQEDINREITDPKEWYFLVEGKNSGIHECEIARKMAEEKKIPIEDPIFNCFMAEVIELYLASNKAEKIPREVLIGQLAVDLANARGTSDLEEVATVLDVASSDELYSNIILAATEKNKDPEAYSARSKQIFNDLVEISNIVSAQVLDYYSRQNPTRTNIALYLGKAHEGIVTMDLSQIPDNLKFNDAQIKDLLDKRKRARVAQVLRVHGIKLREKEKIPFMIKPTVQKEKSKDELISSKKTKIAEVLNQNPNIPENIKILIEKWANNLFGLEFVRSKEYQEYLNSDNSLHQVWGAAVLLADRVNVAKSENRELTTEEKAEVKEAFLKAANSRRKDADIYVSQGDELEELSKNINILSGIIKRLK